MALAFACFGSQAEAADITVTTTAGDSSAGSLAAAINAANANPSDSDKINFDASVTGTIAPTADLPALVGPVEITGPGSGKLTIDGGSTRSLLVTTKDLKVSGLTLAHGNNTDGGAINATGSNLNLSDVTVKDNAAKYDFGKGGGIYLNGGSLTVSNSTFSGNQAQLGGGMWVSDAGVSISGTSITSNVGTYTENPEGVGADADPEADGGGGLFIDTAPSVILKDSTFSQNQGDDGAAFAIDKAGDVQVANTTVADNDAQGRNSNTLFGTAGIRASTATITDSEFTDSQMVTGAGLLISANATIDGCLIANNVAGASSGLTLGSETGQPKIQVTLFNSTITGNKSTVSATGVAASNADVAIDSTTIAGNSVTYPTFPENAGSGLLTLFGTATLTNSIVSGNSPSDINAARDYPTFPGVDAQGRVKSSFSLLGTSKGRAITELVPGSDIQSTDPKLGALADNGGPVPTMLPANDSPVVNKGMTTLTTDARDLPRPVKLANVPISNATGANGADMGAIELQNPDNDFTFGKAKSNRKKGLATVQVKVPGAGKLLLLGSKAVKKSSKTIKKKSTVTMTVKAKGKAAKALQKKGVAKVKATFKFTPTGGLAKQKSKTVKLVKNKSGKGR